MAGFVGHSRAFRRVLIDGRFLALVIFFVPYLKKLRKNRKIMTMSWKPNCTGLAAPWEGSSSFVTGLLEASRPSPSSLRRHRRRMASQQLAVLAVGGEVVQLAVLAVGGEVVVVR